LGLSFDWTGFGSVGFRILRFRWRATLRRAEGIERAFEGIYTGITDVFIIKRG